MKIKYLLLCFLSALSITGKGQTLRLDATQKHQYITGFGGFVCSPQFGYNHMSTTEIKKVWGPTSTVGCNIMRLYIPIGRNSWQQSLQTAKTAKQMGLIVFASPWGQPAEWKTNGTSNAKNSDGTTGSLKRENWADYAKYLEDYVQYLRKNGVELDAISIQNEPDWPAEYAGCLWSASEMAEFVKTYGKSISCKVMAPETLAVRDDYVNALNKSDVLDCFDIYGGHQYGGIQSAYKNLIKKGKEIWMTEYLINWNEGQATSRAFDFSKDFFNFFSAINVCMLGDFNAWIHYAAKRFYGMLGDGQQGTSNGTVTKRGYIMAHFARFVTGMTRIDATFSGAALEGSGYLSQTGDTVVAVLANKGDTDCTLNIDLPFYTTTGKLYTTGKSRNFAATDITLEQETCRPTANIPAQSVATVLFVRSRDRQPSNMKGSATHFNRLDDMEPTRSVFGRTYKLSGKSVTFDHSNPLISSRTNTAGGYLALNDRYDKLVMHINKVTSSMNYTASETTLLYVNDKGALSSHNYGTMDFSSRENIELIFDLSPSTLADGCRGLVSLTCNNWSSVLTISFGEVYLGSSYAGKLSGDYVEDDSYVIDYTNDPSCTSIDMTAVSQLPSSLPWMEGSNRMVYVSEGSGLSGDNIVTDGKCARLSLSDTGGDFHPATTVTADEAELTLTDIGGLRMLVLPFDADVPEGILAYTFDADLHLQPCNTITAHQPVLVAGEGRAVFSGSGEVTYVNSPLDATLRGTYCTTTLHAGDYILAQQDGQWGLKRLTAPTTLLPFGAYANLSSTDDFIPLDFDPTAINRITTDIPETSDTYNLSGRKTTVNERGIVIQNGKKMLRK